MRKYIPAIVPALLCSFMLGAQNVNQTIHVTNDYRTTAPEANKKSLDIKVADSLLVFDYKFDYSVFDTPYRGSYEFSPYSVVLDPRRSTPYYNRLFAKLGAGFTFHPELAVDWELRPTDDLSLSVFADADGYFGRYKLVNSRLAFTGEKAPGFDFTDNAGVSGRWVMLNNTLKFELGQKGIFAADRIAGSAFNSFYFNSSLTSHRGKSSFFYYDLALSYKYGIDAIYYSSANRPNLGEHNLCVSGTAGPVLNETYRFLADIYAEYDVLSTQSRASLLVKLTPHFEFNVGPALFNVGAKIMYNTQKPFVVAPDVKIAASFLSNRLDMTFGLTGDAWMNTHHHLKSLNHFYVPTMLPAGSPTDCLQLSREALAANLSFTAHLKNMLLTLGGGWSDMKSDMSQSYVFSAGRLQDAFALSDYQLLKADFGAEWFSEKFRSRLDLHLRHAYGYKNYSAAIFSPALLSGSLDMRYAFNSRIHAGMLVEASLGRKARMTDHKDEVLRIPAWVCPVLTADYVLNNRWTFWAKAGNLAAMSARHDLTHIQAGPYLTLGAVFIL